MFPRDLIYLTLTTKFVTDIFVRKTCFLHQWKQIGQALNSSLATKKKKLKIHITFNQIVSIIGIYSIRIDMKHGFTYKDIQCVIVWNKPRLEKQPKYPTVEIK